MADTQPVAMLETGEKDHTRVRVEFCREGDLLTHSVSVVSEDACVEVMRSWQGDAGEVSPAAACFSELHQQGETLMLTGASGPCHWSMSVDVRKSAPSSSQTTPSTCPEFLFFDLAVRMKSEIPLVFSQYKLSDNFADFEVTPDQGRAVIPLIGSSKGFLTLDAQAHQEKARCWICNEHDRMIRVSTTDRIPAELPSTLQWSYAIRVA